LPGSNLNTAGGEGEGAKRGRGGRSRSAIELIG